MHWIASQSAIPVFRQIGTEERREQKESGQEHEMDVNEFGQLESKKEICNADYRY
jgi:hypothetical protein